MPNEVELNKYLEECIKIDEFALQTEYIRMPSDFAFWSGRYSEVYGYYMRQKLLLTRLQARKTQEHRLKLESGRTGRVTVGEVEAAVDSDPEYLDQKSKEMEADVELKRLGGVLEALRMKKDMLINLGAHIRAEMTGQDPTTRMPAERSIDRQVREAREG